MFENIVLTFEHLSTPEGLAQVSSTPNHRGRHASYFLDAVRKASPDEVIQKKGATKCIIRIVELHVRTITQARVLLPLIRCVIPALYDCQINTIRGVYTAINNTLRWDQKLHTYSKSIMKLSPIEKAAVIRDRADCVSLKNSHQLHIKFSTVSSIITRFKSSTDIRDICVGIELACGARKIEILSRKVSTFTAVDTSDTWVKQIGVAKHNRAGSEIQIRREIVKPLLILTFDELSKMIARVREDVGNTVEVVTNAELGDKYNHGISKCVKTCFPDIAAQRRRLGSHFLREVYANATYEVINHEPMSRSSWISKVLGHKEGSLCTALSYQGVYVTTTIEPADTETNVHEIAKLRAQLRFLSMPMTHAPSSKVNTVVLKREDGTSIAVPKFRRKRRLTAAEKQDRATQGVDRLKEHGVRVNNANLRKLGIGARVTNAFFVGPH